MNSSKLVYICKTDTILGKIFAGVFPCDYLPAKPTYPFAIIVNTDPKTKPGKHWIAMYFDSDGCGDYYDSYGRQPLPVFEDYLDKHCHRWQSNNKQVQSPFSSTCGQHCVYFLHQRSRNVPMKEIVNQFGSKQMENDEMVKDFVNAVYNKNTKVIDIDFIVDQISE